MDRVQNNAGSTGGCTGRGFTPGRSGNAGGRPRGLARLTRERVGDDGERIVDFWIATMEDVTCKRTERLEASRLLADRGWGRAPAVQPIEEDHSLVLDQEQIDAAVELFNAEVRPLAATPLNAAFTNGHPDAE